MDCDGDSEHREGQKEQRQEQAASDFKTCSTAWRRPSWEVLRLCCVWLFSQSGQDVRSECAIAPAEDRARAPAGFWLLQLGSGWAFTAPSPFLASSLIYPAHSVPQNTRLRGLSLAAGTVLCRSAPGLGWVANGGPAGSAGSTGSGPASEDYSMHGGQGGDVGAKATGSCSRWTAFRTVSTVHQAHLLLVCLCPLPARSLYPSLPCDRSGHSHGGPRILRGYAYHPRDNENIQRRWHHVGPLPFARCKTWLLQSAAKCWVSLSVIW
jgi:hypothetical protein